MTESQLYTLVIATLTAGLANYPEFGTPAVKQAYQPRTAGAPSGDAILLSNQPLRRYGFMRRHNQWIPPAPPEPGRMVRTETQNWEGVFQCNAQVLPPPQPKPLAPYTAGDLVSAASWILQGDDGRGMLQSAGCGVLRVTEIRRPYFQNEQNQFQASPSFDFTLQFEETKTFDISKVAAFAYRIFGV